MTQSRNYRIELVSENGVSRSLAVAKQDPQLVTVVVPASELVRGRYALRLSTVNADGTEQRIKGSYFFVVE
jgi:methionine-rich copper-binding protein CopC